MSDSDDDVPALSAHTLAALQEFYKENSVAMDHSTAAPADQFAVGAVGEDWVSLWANEWIFEPSLFFFFGFESVVTG